MAQHQNRTILYLWEGTDRAGKRVKGELRSVSIPVLKAELRRQGVSAHKIRKKPVALFSKGKKSIRSKEITVFSRQLATMVSSGIPLVQAFEIIGKGSENPSMQEMMMAVKMDLEGGSSLAQSLRKHPKHFDNLFCNLIRAGEQAGILETLLNKIALYKEKTEAIKGKIKKAMYYPVGVMAVAMLILMVMLVKVVPEFQKMFASMGAALPLPTQIVVNMSDIFQQYWMFILGAIGISVYSIIKAKENSEAFRYSWDANMLRLPVLGDLVRKSVIARFSRTLSTMFAAGVPLVDALESVAGAAGNLLYAKAILDIREDVATGQQLQLAMQQTKIFPNMAVQMVHIGEETGSLDSMLAKVADFYEQEVDDAVDGLSSLMEPIIIVIIGVLIGGLVLAMYMPVFQLGQTI
ncbi:MAG: type II secretion system F family protein [Gammaproteobacteria bacterium]|nr:type II secretion system F family protein [Gammaproteobacteria bacterium]